MKDFRPSLDGEARGILLPSREKQLIEEPRRIRNLPFSLLNSLPGAFREPPAPRILSDLSRPATEIGDSARIPPRFHHLRSHKLFKLMKILTRAPIPSLRRSKSDRLLGRGSFGFESPVESLLALACFRFKVFVSKSLRENTFGPNGDD